MNVRLLATWFQVFETARDAPVEVRIPSVEPDVLTRCRYRPAFPMASFRRFRFIALIKDIDAQRTSSSDTSNVEMLNRRKWNTSRIANNSNNNSIIDSGDRRVKWFACGERVAAMAARRRRPSIEYPSIEFSSASATSKCSSRISTHYDVYRNTTTHAEQSDYRTTPSTATFVRSQLLLTTVRYIH
jgi:hypothetical protein